LFSEKGVVFEGFKKLFVIPWSKIVDVEAQGPDEAQRRITVTRVAAFGVLGAAMPKSKKVATIVVQLRSGEQALFRTSEKVAPEINAKLVPAVSQMHRAEREAVAARAAAAPRPAQPPPPVAGGESSVADELSKVRSLLESGLITQEQFDSQRDRLLGATKTTPPSSAGMPVTRRDPATLSESEREWYGID
jgi:hypothetical protein